MQGQQTEIQDLRKQFDHLKLKDFENPNEFKIKTIDSYPNRLICFIKLKLTSSEKGRISVFGTGCLIDQRYIITSAHTIIKLTKEEKKFQKSKIAYQMEGYIKQALHEGKDICQCKIIKSTIRISQLYSKADKGSSNDFAVFEIQPIQGQPPQKEQKYIPIVALRQKQADKIKAISLYGYPFVVNKKQNFDEKNKVDRPSSLFMANAYGSTGAAVEYTCAEISYKIPTDSGVSGGPIITFDEELKEHVLIGIHKAFERGSQDRNFGVTALQMLPEVNQWGYQLFQKPLIFTRNTLFLRNNPAVQKTDVFNLMDRNLDQIDMLVLSSYDLTHLKKLILSGNQVKEQGLRIILRRSYPNLESLFLTSNEIDSLDLITDEEWLRVSKIKTLSLSLNHLKTIPSNLRLLSELQKLWICYNNLEEIPELVFGLNSENQWVRRTVHIYENQLKKDDVEHLNVKKQLAQKNVTLILNKYEK